MHAMFRFLAKLGGRQTMQAPYYCELMAGKKQLVTWM
jgi:hypothetical protein